MPLSLELVVGLVFFCMLYVCNGSPTTNREKEHTLYKMKHWERCETSSDCGEDECCVSLRNSKVRVCKKRPQLGNLCRPNMMPGLSHSCPCTIGLTCALTALDNFGRHDTFQCVLVPEEEQEIAVRQER